MFADSVAQGVAADLKKLGCSRDVSARLLQSRANQLPLYGFKGQALCGKFDGNGPPSSSRRIALLGDGEAASAAA